MGAKREHPCTLCITSIIYTPFLSSHLAEYKRNTAIKEYDYSYRSLLVTFLANIIAERLSARQLIVQCGLKSQLAYYIYIYVRNFVTLRNAIKSPLTFLIRVITMSVRSVYALLLQL